MRSGHAAWLLGALVVVAAACGGSEAGSGAEILDEETSVEGDGVALQVRTIGPQDARDTLILLHGGPGLSLEAMDGYQALAGADRRVVSYDQRGAGRSSIPGDLDYRLDAHVADLEALRISMGVDTVELLGQSWGGAIAAAYAATHPDRVTALVLVGAVPLDVPEYLAGQRRFQDRVTELQRLGLVEESIPSIDEGSCTAAFSAVLPAYLADPGADVTVDIGSCTAETSRATYEAFVADETVLRFADDLASFDSPTLLLAGERDVFGPEWLERHHELLVAAPVETVLIDDAGHLVLAEQPDVTLDALAAFLELAEG